MKEKSKKRKIFFVFFSAFFLAGIFLTNFLARAGTVTPNSSFNPNFLLADNDLINTTSMSVEQIQAFLKAKNSPLVRVEPYKLCRECIYNSKGDCIKVIFCKTPNKKSAAQLIYEAATIKDKYGKYIGVNPAVILVTLQKEQSLITRDSVTQFSLDWAMGYGAYESGDWESDYAGFNNQVKYASKFLRKNYEVGRGPDLCGGSCYLGDSFRVENTTSYYNVPSSQAVKPTNKATMPFYRYTPHVFNGNYNFWYYWTYWFGSPYNIKIYEQPVINATSFIEGNVIEANFRIINKNQISTTLDRLKMSIYGTGDPQDISGASNITLGSQKTFTFKDNDDPLTINKRTLDDVGYYQTLVLFMNRGKWYRLSGAKSYKITIRSIKPSAFYLKPTLALSDYSILKGQSTTGTFVIYNNTHVPLKIERLKIMFWNDDNAFDLAYGSGGAVKLVDKISFSRAITINKAGTYKARVLAKVNGKWIVPYRNIDRTLIVK